jgi:hypothetical protein
LNPATITARYSQTVISSSCSGTMSLAGCSGWNRNAANPHLGRTFSFPAWVLVDRRPTDLL